MYKGHHPTSLRLGLWRRCQCSRDGDGDHTKHHQDLRSQRNSPDPIQDIGLVAPENALRIVKYGAVTDLGEQEGEEAIECVPVRSGL